MIRTVFLKEVNFELNIPWEIDSESWKCKGTYVTTGTPKYTWFSDLKLKIQTCTQADTVAQSVRPTVTKQRGTGMHRIHTSITHNQTTPGSFRLSKVAPALPELHKKRFINVETTSL